MSVLRELYKKRRNAWSYDLDRIPDPKVVIQCFRDAQRESPSKQNEQPYKVNIYGPGCQQIKNTIHKRVIKKHIQMQEKALARGLTASKLGKAKTELRDKTKPLGVELQTPNWEGTGGSPNYRHIVQNPYLVLFSQRLITDPNQFNLNNADAGGHYLEHADPLELENQTINVAVEVGLFADAVSLFLAEKGIGSSYHICFEPDAKNWTDIPGVVHYIKEGPKTGEAVGKMIVMMSVGYTKLTKREKLALNEEKNKKEKKEKGTAFWSDDHYESNTKPPFNDVVQYFKDDEFVDDKIPQALIQKNIADKKAIDELVLAHIQKEFPFKRLKISNAKWDFDPHKRVKEERKRLNKVFMKDIITNLS